MPTTPNVFIIESNDWNDERKRRSEGEVLCSMLRLAGRDSQYYYVRTSRELKPILRRFAKSGYRYLHLACHGTDDGIALTLDRMSFADVVEQIGPHLKDKRLFLSICSGARKALAGPLLEKHGCRSVAGPVDLIEFRRAAIIWAGCYTRMSCVSNSGMRDSIVEATLADLCDAFRVEFRIFSAKGKRVVGRKELAE